MRFPIVWLAAVFVTLGCSSGLSGCATPPLETAVALDSAQCQALRAQLDAADSRGTPALAEKAGNGGALSVEQRQQVNAYDEALEAYLGGLCHNNGKP